MLRFLLVEAAQVTARSIPEWRSKYFHLMMRRGRKIAKVAMVRSNLQIKQQGKWRNAISVRSDKVPDVLVFLETLEFLAPQIKATGIDPLARVRM
jgi:hypothetical protein